MSILAALGIASSERERLVEMAREVDAPNWLRPGIPGVREELVTLIEYERTADHVVETAPLLVPGILQASDYARATMAGLPAGEREAKIGMRAGRRDVLTKSGAPAFETFILEHVLQGPVCAGAAQVDQLRHLLMMSELENVSIRVVSSEQGWTPMHSGHFLYFEFGDASPIAHLETLGSGVFLSSPNVVSTYAEAIGSLRRAAMSERDSEQFIDTCLERAKETS